MIHEMAVWDLGVIPLKSRPVIAIGRIAGDYRFRAEAETGLQDWSTCSGPLMVAPSAVSTASGSPIRRPVKSTAISSLLGIRSPGVHAGAAFAQHRLG